MSSQPFGAWNQPSPSRILLGCQGDSVHLVWLQYKLVAVNQSSSFPWLPTFITTTPYNDWRSESRREGKQGLKFQFKAQFFIIYVTISVTFCVYKWVQIYSNRDCLKMCAVSDLFKWFPCLALPVTAGFSAHLHAGTNYLFSCIIGPFEVQWRAQTFGSRLCVGHLSVEGLHHFHCGWQNMHHVNHLIWECLGFPQEPEDVAVCRKMSGLYLD